jgi:hypothetical protein
MWSFEVISDILKSVFKLEAIQKIKVNTMVEESRFLGSGAL